MIRYAVFVVISSALFGCRWLMGPDEEITLGCDKSITGLRKDGYYYQSNVKENENTNAFFLYDNGIIFSVGAFPLVELNEREKLYSDSLFINKLKKIKFCWGILNENGISVQIEQWRPGSGPYYIFRKTGKILNDSTFIIYETKRLDGSEEDSTMEMYMLRKYDNKPSSYNQFLCKQ